MDTVFSEKRLDPFSITWLPKVNHNDLFVSLSLSLSLGLPDGYFQEAFLVDMLYIYSLSPHPSHTFPAIRSLRDFVGLTILHVSDSKLDQDSVPTSSGAYQASCLMVPGVKRSERVDDHSAPSGARVRSEWNCSPPCPYNFVALTETALPLTSHYSAPILTWRNFKIHDRKRLRGTVWLQICRYSSLLLSYTN